MAKDFRKAITNNIAVKEQFINRANNDKLSLENKELKAKIAEMSHALKSESNKEGSEVSIDTIKLGTNCRELDFMAIDELSLNIKQYGQLQPVLVSSDNYLICGYRRYYALKNLKKHHILIHKLDKSYKALQPILLQLQFTENDKRQNLDNFEVASLFQGLIHQGITQKDITELFNREKSTVSKLLKLNECDNDMKVLIKEIQLFGYSKEKLHAYNLKKKEFKVIGINTLYSIVNKLSYSERCRAFINTFRKALTDQQISYFTKHFKEVSPKDYKAEIKDKAQKLLNEVLEKLDNSKNRYEIESHLSEIMRLLDK